MKSDPAPNSAMVASAIEYKTAFSIISAIPIPALL